MRGRVIAFGIAAAACSKDTVVTTRSVAMHAPACAPLEEPVALFYAFGDFEPQGEVPSLPLADVGTELAGVSAEMRELEIDATSADERAWRAHALVNGGGDIDVLLLPYRSPCALTDAIDARTGAMLGAVDTAHVLVAGGEAVSGAVPTTSLVDLARGAVTALANGLLVPREHGAITSSPAGAIVAGGERPDTGERQASAELYSSAIGDFDGAPIALSEARSHLGAAVIASGETLLVGGLGGAGSGTVLGSMEIVDGVSKRARTSGLASLATPRVDPVVLRLASGEVLVAGGTDANGAPVGTLEWFAPDASTASRRPTALVASSQSAFVALDAGGALAVIAPDVPTNGFQNAWVVSADGSLTAATSIAGALTAPQLFDGPSGAPILWTGDRWLAWQPWSGSFAALEGVPSGAAGPAGDPATTAEPGLALWADGAAVRALRFGARGPYATTPASEPLLTADASFFAPDRLVTGAPGDPVRFDSSTGLSLDEGASAFLTDATFASFTLDALVPSGAPPAIVLRDPTGTETVLDALACPIATPVASIHVERDGASVRVSTNGGALAACSIGPSAVARVAIGARGESGGSTLRSLVVTR